MRKAWGLLALSIILVLILSTPAIAWVVQAPNDQNGTDRVHFKLEDKKWDGDSNDAVIIGKNEVINDDLFAAGASVEISGTVNGDVVVFAQKVEVNGRINGDLITACQNVTVNGVIYDDLRSASQNTVINGSVYGNITSACNSFNIDREARVLGNASIAGQNIINNGMVDGRLSAAGQDIEINGTVGNNLNAKANMVSIGSGAKIGGDFIYASNRKAEIESGAVIAGKTSYTKIEVDQTRPKEVKPSFADGVIAFFVWLAAAMLVWVVWRYSYPDSVEKLHRSLELSLPASLGWGIILLIIVPIVSIILMCTVVGIPMAFVTMGFYFLMLYVSKIVVGFRLGEVLLQAIGKYRVDQPALTALIGIMVLMLLGMIPFIGVIIKLFVFCLGLGSMFIAIREGIAVRNSEI